MGDWRHGLILYDMVANRRVNLASFSSLPGYEGEIRCDFHARWSPDGAAITFDSFHEGFRGIYWMDVSDIVEPEREPEGVI